MGQFIGKKSAAEVTKNFDMNEARAVETVNEVEVPAENVIVDSANITETSVSKFSICFNGKIDPLNIANSLKWMLGENTIGTVEISCTVDRIMGQC